MDKKTLTEADIRTKFILPALVGPAGGGWNVMTQLREEVFFTNGLVMVRSKVAGRGERKKADYLLHYKPGIPIAVPPLSDGASLDDEFRQPFGARLDEDTLNDL
jgi:type I restriction enzyme R subunit